MAPSRLIFGSCTSLHHKHQPLWHVIEKRNATAFVWGGDAVYADDRIEEESSKKGIFVSRKNLPATPDYLKELYQRQRQDPGYRRILESNISIFGTMDDHDYGINNGDSTFRWKRENGMEFVEFLGLPKDSAMSQRASNGYGVYGVQVYDFSRSPKERLLSDQEAGLDPDVVPISPTEHELPPKEAGNRLVAVFVLDMRTNKTPWKKSFPKRFWKDEEGDFLGEQQWEWFETAIQRSQAAVNVVVTGLQVHAERFYDGSLIEEWGRFPNAQHRFYQALLKPNVQAPILISGDVHHAQLLRKDCRYNNADSSLLRPLYEVTTSGMTHSWGSYKTSTCGRLTNRICRNLYYNSIYRPALDLAHRVCPWNEVIVDEDSDELQYSLDLNVAELDFDWDDHKVVVRILGEEDRVLLQQNWKFQDLSRITSTAVNDKDFENRPPQLQDLSILQRGNGQEEWTCVHYRGLPGRVHFAVGLASVATLLIFLATLPLVLCLFFVWRIICGRRKTSKNGKRQEKAD